MKSVKKYIFLSLAPVVTLVSTDLAAEIDISGSYRVRVELVDNPVRQAAGSSDQALSHRLTLKAKYSSDNFYAVAELMDARMWLDDEDTPLGTDDVNALEPIQAHLGFLFPALDGKADVKLGRFTVDMGSRRFVARTRYRNTHNSFTGVLANFQRNFDTWQFIYAAPDNRLPRSRDELDSNSVKLDKPYADNVFYGVHFNRKYATKATGEWFYFGLKEEDQADLGTRNRDIHTFGIKWDQAYLPNDWGYQLAAAYQFGDARASSSAADITDLDVSAYFFHLSFGYKFTDNWKSTLLFEFDYATGDDNPADDEYNRFDTLYGVRRFDFGATNLYGTFARSNILAPGLRWKFSPAKDVGAFLGYRPVWLADKDDALPAIGARNTTRESFAGHQFETRIRHQIQDNIRFETGAAYLIKGKFFDDVQNANPEGNTTYFYVQTTYSF